MIRNVEHLEIALAPLPPERTVPDEPRLVGRKALQRARSVGDASIEREAISKSCQACQLMPLVTKCSTETSLASAKGAFLPFGGMTALRP